MATKSTAVYAQRVSAPGGLDYFPTPPWATRAFLAEVLVPMVGDLSGLTCWEPACGEMAMALPLREAFGRVWTSDIHEYRCGQDGVGDFTAGPLDQGWSPPDPVDWIITNPPFARAEAFARSALSRARAGVALLLRTAWLESGDRYQLFRSHPPAALVQHVERVPMVEGRCDPGARSATAYAWFVWTKPARDLTEMRVLFVPPCRALYERPGDYDRWASIGPLL